MVEAVKEPPWATNNTVARQLIPLILAGAWDSSAKADREVLRCLTNNRYEETEQTVAQLMTAVEPPVWSTGQIRGVVSKVDALYAAQPVPDQGGSGELPVRCRSCPVGT